MITIDDFKKVGTLICDSEGKFVFEITGHHETERCFKCLSSKGNFGLGYNIVLSGIQSERYSLFEDKPKKGDLFKWAKENNDVEIIRAGKRDVEIKLIDAGDPVFDEEQTLQSLDVYSKIYSKEWVLKSRVLKGLKQPKKELKSNPVKEESPKWPPLKQSKMFDPIRARDIHDELMQRWNPPYDFHGIDVVGRSEGFRLVVHPPRGGKAMEIFEGSMFEDIASNQGGRHDLIIIDRLMPQIDKVVIFSIRNFEREGRFVELLIEEFLQNIYRNRFKPLPSFQLREGLEIDHVDRGLGTIVNITRESFRIHWRGEAAMTIPKHFIYEDIRRGIIQAHTRDSIRAARLINKMVGDDRIDALTMSIMTAKEIGILPINHTKENEPIKKVEPLMDNDGAVCTRPIVKTYLTPKRIYGKSVKAEVVTQTTKKKVTGKPIAAPVMNFPKISSQS